MLNSFRMMIVLALAGCLAGTDVLGQSNGNGVQGTDKAVSKAPPMQSSKGIVQAINTNPRFKTLASALKQADLEAMLSKPGPFTVFVPDNEAFEALPAGTQEALLRDRNKETLTSILKFHVVPGRITMTDLEDGQKLKTINGEELSVAKMDGKVTVNGVEIDQPDLMVSNGIIHVVGQVLLPPRQGMVGNKKQ